MRTSLTLILLLWATALSAAQSCYYPNGDLSTTDAPCGIGDAVSCCPLNWVCMSNGLCYLPSEDYLSRYTCTDQTWASDACPHICDEKTASNGTSSGDEAISQCGDVDQNCCNGDRSGNCCNDNEAVMFDLGGAEEVTTITALAPPSSVDSATSTIESAQTGTMHLTLTETDTASTLTSSVSTASLLPTPSEASKISSMPSSTATATGQVSLNDITISTSTMMVESNVSPYTSTVTSTFTSDGHQVTVTILILVSPAASTSTNSATASPSQRSPGKIAGIAIPLSLIAVAVAVFVCLRCRREARRMNYHGPYSDFDQNEKSDSAEICGQLLHQEQTSELPGDNKMTRWPRRLNGPPPVEIDGKAVGSACTTPGSPPPAYLSPESHQAEFGGGQRDSMQIVPGRVELA